METIDEAFIDEKIDLLTPLKWWEKRRWVFNLAVGVSGVLGLFLFNVYFPAYIFVEIILYGIFLNVLYSSGYILEALIAYYSKGKYSISGFRLGLFAAGTLLSVMVTFVICFLFPVP
jgi:hypothetical protein